MASSSIKPETSRIELRPFSEEDWPVVWSWMEDCWIELADDFSPKDIEAFVEIKRNQNAINIGVFVEDDLAGVFIFIPISPILTQVHTIFRPSFRDGQTAARAAEICKEAIWRMGYWKISCVCFEDNLKVRRLIEKVGGIYEGKLLSHTQREGQLVDMVSYAILAD